MGYCNVGDTFKPKAFKRAPAAFAQKNDLCPACIGVGCLPEHFGQMNPNPKPCATCGGRGWIKKKKRKA